MKGMFKNKKLKPIDFSMKDIVKPALDVASISPFGALQMPQMDFSNIIGMPKPEHQCPKKAVIAGKEIIFKSTANRPNLNVIRRVYRDVDDDREVPVVVQTKRQYLKEYIANQEKKKRIDYPETQEKDYINRELKRMKPVVTRYTTKHNKYMEPRIVIFTDNKLTDNQLHDSLLHEHGHEIWERNKNIRKDWHSVNKNNSPTTYGKTDKEEDFADSYSLYKTGKLRAGKRKRIIGDRVSRNSTMPKFGSVDWQEEMVKTIQHKLNSNESLSPQEDAFLHVMKDKLETKYTLQPDKESEDLKISLKQEGLDVNRYGFKPERSVVHGTSIEAAKQIKESGKLKEGTFMYPGRGGFEDASVWSKNIFGEKAAVVLAETPEELDRRRSSWITLGERRKEREGMDITDYEELGVNKIKIFNVKNGDLEEIEDDEEGVDDFKEQSDTPFPDYPEEYGRKGKLIYMSPRRFMKFAQQTSGDEKSREMPIEEYEKRVIFPSNLVRIKEGIRQKEEVVPAPWLEFRGGRIVEHEGRHRAKAAEDLGFHDIPVRIVDTQDIPEKGDSILYEPDFSKHIIKPTPQGKVITMPTQIAWDMRSTFAAPQGMTPTAEDMEPHRGEESMATIREGIRRGFFQPIEATQDELDKGILTDGKHRLIVAKDLGIKNVPIEIIEKDESEDAILYHGTSKKDYEKIKNEGLVPYANYWGPPAVFLTANKDVAKIFGKKKGENITLKVDIPDTELQSIGHGDWEEHREHPFHQIRIYRKIDPVDISKDKIIPNILTQKRIGKLPMMFLDKDYKGARETHEDIRTLKDVFFLDEGPRKHPGKMQFYKMIKEHPYLISDIEKTDPHVVVMSPTPTGRLGEVQTLGIKKPQYIGGTVIPLKIKDKKIQTEGAVVLGYSPLNKAKSRSYSIYDDVMTAEHELQHIKQLKESSKEEKEKWEANRRSEQYDYMKDPYEKEARQASTEKGVEMWPHQEKHIREMARLSEENKDITREDRMKSHKEGADLGKEQEKKGITEGMDMIDKGKAYEREKDYDEFIEQPSGEDRHNRVI